MVPRLGLTPGPSCSSAQAHLAGGSCSIPCPKHCQGEMATAALLLQVQGQRSPHETEHVDLGLPITFHPLWSAAAVLPHGRAAAIPSMSRAGAAPLLHCPPSQLQGKTTSYPPPETSETMFSKASLHPFTRVTPKCHHFPAHYSPTMSFQETHSAK